MSGRGAGRCHTGDTRIDGQLIPDEFRRRVEAGEEQARAGAGSFPIYGLCGWDAPIMLGDREWQDTALILAGLAYGTLDTDRWGVGTTGYDPRRHALRMMERAIGLTPIESNYARHHRAIHNVPGREVQVRVDGCATSFTLWGG